MVPLLLLLLLAAFLLLLLVALPLPLSPAVLRRPLLDLQRNAAISCASVAFA
jgi:hypothetical protein